MIATGLLTTMLFLGPVPATSTLFKDPDPQPAIYRLPMFEKATDEDCDSQALTCLPIVWTETETGLVGTLGPRPVPKPVPKKAVPEREARSIPPSATPQRRRLAATMLLLGGMARLNSATALPAPTRGVRARDL